MKRLFAVATVLCLCALFATNAFAVGVAPSRLIPEKEANAAGLTRAWFAQATLNRDFEEVSSATVQDGLLFITTTDGILQVFDAETGSAMWTISVGESYLLPPAVNSRVVAAISGTQLIIYDRFTGKKLDETEIYGQPAAGPTLSERECYIPVLSEKILAYPLIRKKQEQLSVDESVANMLGAVKDNNTVAPEMESKFAAFVQEKDARYAIEPLGGIRPYVTASFGVPVVTPIVGTQTYPLDVVGWATDQGWLMFAQMERNVGDTPFKLLYKLQDRPHFAFINERRLGNRALIPRSELESTPCFIPEDKSAQNMRLSADKRRGGMFIVGSKSGHVFAMNDVTGLLRWTYLTDKPISERVSAFGDHAFIPTDNGDFFAVALRDGKEAWRATEITRLVAASASRVYAVDTLNRLAVLNRETGSRVKTLDIGNTKFQVFNQWTDRVYIVTGDGLIQCLHETNQVDPLRHRETCQMTSDRIKAQLYKIDPQSEPKAAPVAPAATPASTPAASSFDDEEDDPFGSDDDDPFGGSSDSDADSTPDDGEDDFDEDDPFAEGDEEDPFA